MTRVLSPLETVEAVRAAKAFVDAITEHSRGLWPDLDTWAEADRTNAIMAQALQHIIMPETFAAALDMDFIAYTLGVVMGVRAAAFNEAQTHQLILQFQRGFFVGREEQTQAVINMPTVGNA